MSGEPGSGFGISEQGVLDLARSLEKAGAASAADAFPAALLVPTWRALLDSGAIETPARVDLARVEVRLVGPNVIELRVPVRTRSTELVKSITVWVERWTSGDELAQQLTDAAESLARALEDADSRPTLDLGGSGQKPHN